jgi:hypothetical protein
MDKKFDACPIVRVRGGLPQGFPALARFTVVEQAGILKTFYPAYLSLIARLRKIPLSDRTLAESTDAMAELASYYRPILKSSTDECRLLRLWKRAGWKDDFDVAGAIGAKILTRHAPANIRRARQSIIQAQARLVEVGVPPTTAEVFRRLAELPGSTTQD